MTQKIGMGGSNSQPEEQERFTAYLIDKLKPKDTAEFEQMISSYTEKELNELYKQFRAMEGSLFAKMGAKLDYLTRLNGKCPEGYEVEKFSAGGCAKCKKKILTFQNSGQVKPRFTQKINPADTVHVDGQPRTLTDDRGRPLVKKMKVYSTQEYQRDQKAARKGDNNAKKRVQKQDEKTMYKCGGKSKKRITKHKCGSAFKKVNGGPGSVDSTRDMKPNKKQRKMIKKHQQGGITLLTAPDATARYSGGRKNYLGMPTFIGGNTYYDKTVNKPLGLTVVSGNDGSLFKYPSTITQFISGNTDTNKMDTIYTETPNHSRFNIFQNVKTRRASSQNPNQEYQTMKSRFQTASNVSK